MSEYQYGMAAPHVRRKASRDYHERNRDKINAQKRARYQRNKESEGARFAAKRQTPEHKAGQKLRYAVFSGKIVKPDSCSQCGKVGPVEGHHADYSKPLEVIWLCASCHGLTRRKRDALIAAAPEMLEALEAAYKLFAKNHALSRFDWGSSALRAEDIRELNELPLQLRAAIQKAKGGQ